MTLVTRSSFNLIPRPCRRNCYGHSCDWPACRPRNAARGARARARAKRDSDSRTHLANPIGLDQNKATSSPKRRDVSKWAISIPGFRRRCYVRDTPASFCSPPRRFASPPSLRSRPSGFPSFSSLSFCRCSKRARCRRFHSRCDAAGRAILAARSRQKRSPSVKVAIVHTRM